MENRERLPGLSASIMVVYMVRKLTMLSGVAFALGALLAQTPSQNQTKKAAPAATGKTAAKPSVNKVAIEAYVRHLFVWPTPIEVTVGDPKPSPIPGFYEVSVRGSQGEASQEETFYVSADGQKMVRGTVFDMAKNPFKEDLDKLKTDYQPSFGTPGAPVVIVEFSDFECPYCRQEAEIIRQNLLSAYPKEVRLYYMDFPLESLHPWAKSAAMAGRCIFHQSASTFWDLSRLDFREPGRHHAGKSDQQGSGICRRAEEPRRGSAFQVHRFVGN